MPISHFMCAMQIVHPISLSEHRNCIVQEFFFRQREKKLSESKGRRINKKAKITLAKHMFLPITFSRIFRLKFQWIWHSSTWSAKKNCNHFNLIESVFASSSFHLWSKVIPESKVFYFRILFSLSVWCVYVLSSIHISLQFLFNFVGLRFSLYVSCVFFFGFLYFSSIFCLFLLLFCVCDSCNACNISSSVHSLRTKKINFL